MGEVKDRQWSIFTNLNKFFKTVRVCLVQVSCRFAIRSISCDAGREVNEKSNFSDFFELMNENRD